MSAGVSGSGRDVRWLWLLAALGVLSAAALVALALLFLSVPGGWTPFFGFAPDVGAAWAPRWPLPLPARNLTPAGFQLRALGLLVLAWGSWGAACLLVGRLARQLPDQRALLAVIAAGAVLAQLALVLTPPTLSKDLYHYALFGRMLVTRGLNPYLNPGDVLAGDPLWALANWRELHTHYGPVFTGLSAVAAWLGGGGVIATALAFKGLAAIGSLVTGWAIWRLAAGSNDRQAAARAPTALVLFAWNPLVVMETGGSGHNDTVMLALALTGLLLVRQEGSRWRLGAGFLLLVLSVHVKWLTAALAGLVVIDRVRAARGFGERVATAGGLGVIALGTTVALYLPFWSGGRGGGGLGSTAQLLLEGRRIEGRPGAGGLASLSVSPGQALSLLIFVATVALAVVVVWRRGQVLLLEMSAIVSLAFVLAVFAWLFPWYLIPALALLAVGPRAPLNRGLLALLLTGAVTLTAGWAMLSPGLSR